MNVLAIDLASKMSALCVLSDDGQVLFQADSLGQTQSQWLDVVVYAVVRFSPEVVGVEDLPHGLKFAGLVKDVCRLQGRLLERLAVESPEAFARVCFIPPACWQQWHEGVWRKGPGGAAEAASLLGYSPPDLLTERADSLPPSGPERQAMRNACKKGMTDYVDAFLIAWFLQEYFREHSTFDAPTIQRYKHV